MIAVTQVTRLNTFFRHLKRGCGKIGFATAPSLIHLKGQLKLLHHTALTALSEENTSKSEE